MKILITGAFGFIGYSVAVRLLKQGHTVIGIDKAQDRRGDKGAREENLAKFENFKFCDCNLSNYEQTRTLLSMLDFDAVMHFAGQYSVALTPISLQAFIDGNLRSFLHVMQCAQEKGIKRVIYASSTFVQDGVIPTSMYGATLEFRERSAGVYSALGMETVGLRFGSTYGPYIRPDVGMYIIAKKLLSGTPINTAEGGFRYNTGMLYIADAVECVVRLLDAPLEQKHNVFTLVANEPVVSLTHILSLMENFTGITAKRTADPVQIERGYTPTERLAPLQQAIGYMPHTTIEEGTRKFMDWFRPRFDAGRV